MEEALKYNTYKHRQTALCWLTINTTLTIAYIIEIFNKHRTWQYVLLFLMFAWTPWIVFMLCRLVYKVSDTNLEYIAGLGYLIFYVFAVLTSNTILVFIYIFPMLCILTVYSNHALNNIVMSVTIAVNIFITFFNVNDIRHFDPTVITDYEIELSCLFLCAIFLYSSSKVLALRDTMIETLANDAYFDVLTKIHNRMYLVNLTKRQQEEGLHVKSLALIDVDNFKGINDTHGHLYGDISLIKVAELLTSVTKSKAGTTVIRLGGDEFAIVSTTLDATDMYEICSKFKRKLAADKPHSAKKEVIDVTTSIGILQGKEGAYFTDLYDSCDNLLYAAKARGRNQIVVETNGLLERSVEK